MLTNSRPHEASADANLRTQPRREEKISRIIQEVARSIPIDTLPGLNAFLVQTVNQSSRYQHPRATDPILSVHAFLSHVRDGAPREEGHFPFNYPSQYSSVPRDCKWASAEWTLSEKFAISHREQLNQLSGAEEESGFVMLDTDSAGTKNGATENTQILTQPLSYILAQSTLFNRTKALCHSVLTTPEDITTLLSSFGSIAIMTDLDETALRIAHQMYFRVVCEILILYSSIIQQEYIAKAQIERLAEMFPSAGIFDLDQLMNESTGGSWIQMGKAIEASTFMNLAGDDREAIEGKYAEAKRLRHICNMLLAAGGTETTYLREKMAAEADEEGSPAPVTNDATIEDPEVQLLHRTLDATLKNLGLY